MLLWNVCDFQCSLACHQVIWYSKLICTLLIASPCRLFTQDGDEDPESMFYVNYIHIVNATVTEGQSVTKGQIVAYSFRTKFEHLHFEVQAGGLFSANACIQWKYLPNINNNYTSFVANIELHPNFNVLNCEAVVNVSVPAYRL